MPTLILTCQDYDETLQQCNVETWQLLDTNEIAEPIPETEKNELVAAIALVLTLAFLYRLILNFITNRKD